MTFIDTMKLYANNIKEGYKVFILKNLTVYPRFLPHTSISTYTYTREKVHTLINESFFSPIPKLKKKSAYKCIR